MTKEEFFIRLCELAKLPRPTESTLKRPLLVSVSNANYGRPSAAIIELEGSPPHLTVMVKLFNYGTDIIVGRRVIAYSRSPERTKAMQKLVESFLDSNGYLEKQSS